MFYSETLLSKTGPLARVWLAANIERKLNKKDVLSAGIERSVDAIVDQGQAPMALRLSGQLLLGVVRIYSRKTNYLFDDCNEAITKIKMAFKPGNVDLPVDQSHAVNPATLTLPDVITELDLLAPMPDPDLLFADPLPTITGAQRDPTLLDWGASQVLTESLDRSQMALEPLPLDDDGLILDIGDGPDDTAFSIERGRRAAPERDLSDEFGDNDAPRLYDDDLDLDIGDGPSKLGGDMSLLPGDDGDIAMGGLDDVPMQLPSDDATHMTLPGHRRDSHSPLSSIGASMERELEASFRPFDDATRLSFDPDETALFAPNRAKKRRVLPADATTELSSKYIKELQNDRTRILKPASFLPRDPYLLALMQMQQQGAFVSTVLGDGRMKGWAPELRDLFSADAIRKSGDLKRKRDSGVADLEDMPQLEIPSEGNEDPFGLEHADPTLRLDSDGVRPYDEEDQGLAAFGGQEDTFDDTTMPILHPADAGPLALSTTHAVHLLRDRFGSYDQSASPSSQKKQSILFNELAPENRATAAEATKMFFEVLVLATKDAIKVEQVHDVLDGPIRIRSKRGLWGDWAEKGAGGEMDAQGQQEGEAVA
ncbi:hypothetical protein P152DRAFT_403379 [Eremomyces bilateralis CBS 781.70]|uniref:Double-strand-break repair protein rad21 n=1 Tax=Eremomyces bilateralis CBS 781.70 TaxID=1392243 RepID=A0A6G1FU70_9PEZI|nr:uncharacterized protein P152DRAFT_403379 [Eremomyces bilateralis CBS 781.70]KAF1809347.1 hypothetical protein P152DRAFT_403379 [Eremomyces bilateralis CBS 781.70]